MLKQPTQARRTVAGVTLEQTPYGWRTLDGRWRFEAVAADGWVTHDRDKPGGVARFTLAAAVKAAIASEGR